jgi:glycerol-3-phosphate acyltransferase PlsX
MRVVVDAMGGDAAPQVTVAGAVAALQAAQGTAHGGREYQYHPAPGLQVILVGREILLRAELAKHPQGTAVGSRTQYPPVEVVDAPEVVEMHEHPANAVRQKRHASIVVAMRLLREGRADAVFSAGNSGAVMAAALLTLGRIAGVHRPAIGAVVPLLGGRCLLLDVGANADCDPHNLVQFARMGAAYMEHVYGRERPRVGLVSTGEEETKGNALVQATFPLLRASGVNFVGNVEGKDITRGVADVVVCDGFTGNVMLKLAEGVQELIFDLIRGAVRSKVHYRLAGAILLPGLRAAGKQLDYTEYGGAPLIGVRGAVFIGHGRSNAKAIANGIRAAAEAASGDLVGKLQAGLAA